MKRCPECRRDYHDDSLNYCLDDGSVLVDGPQQVDGETTAFLSAGRRGQGGLSESSTRVLSSERLSTSERGNSIAVLPFRNIGGNGDDEYFSDGLTEELIADLSKVRSLRVISRGSSMRLKDTNKDTLTIARELNVCYILDGSVRKSGDKIRISAQLIDGSSDENLWSEKYAGTLDDIFEMQESVSRSVVDALKITLSPEEVKGIEARPIADPQAYDVYLRARAAFLQGDPAALDRAISLLEQGIQIIGDNELLYAALGYTHYFYFRWISKLDHKRLELADEYMRKTFVINDKSSHGFTLKGLLSYSHGDMIDTITSLEKAVKIEPNNTEALLWLVVNHNYIGNYEAGRKYSERLLSVDPLTPINVFINGFSYVYNGEFEKALPLVDRALQIDPTSPLIVWSALIIEAWAGHLDRAVKFADQLEAAAPGWIYTKHGSFLKYALLGDKQKALSFYSEEFETEAAYDSHFALHIAHCFALVGETGRALDFLETAITKGLAHPRFLGEVDPLLENLRGEERFGQLIDEAKRLQRSILASI